MVNLFIAVLLRSRLLFFVKLYIIKNIQNIGYKNSKDTISFFVSIIHYAERDVQSLKSLIPVIEFAPAKINLALSVGKKRADGYHEIDTVMHSVSLMDMAEMRPSDENRVVVSGADLPEGPGNLAWEALMLFLKETACDACVRIVLTKRIPLAAGLGGGSSDAAAVLRGMRHMTGMDITDEELRIMAAKIGSDVPFCISGGCARCRGRGEIISHLLPWDGLPVVIVRPEISVSTSRAYREAEHFPHIQQQAPEKISDAIGARDMDAFCRSLRNDFEDFLFPVSQELAETKEYLEQFDRPVQMTGSGSAFFLLSVSGREAEHIVLQIKRDHPGWFTDAARTMGGL